VTIANQGALKVVGIRIQLDEPTFAKFNWEMVRVLLRCDFVLDSDTKIPVDGNFLSGKLPTGDGVAGGLFESWFWMEG
jgi:hypothetical protein